MATNPTPIATLTTDWTWLKTHIILLALVAGLAWGGIYYVESLIVKHDKATEAHYAQILQTQTAQTKAIEDKLASDEKAWQEQQAQLVAQNQQLAQQNAARDAQLINLLGKINQLQPPQIVADLQPKLRQGAATVLPDGIKLDTVAARDVDAQITEGATAKQDLINTKVQLANETTIATNSQKDVVEAKAAIIAEQTKNTDQSKSCAAQIQTITNNARKSKSKWFIIGYVAGFLTRVVTVK